VEEQLVETWNIHNRINLYMLDAIDAESLGTSLNGKSRTVYQLLAHMHNVRLMWLKAAAPDLLAGLTKLEGDSGDAATLRKSLEDSGAAIAELIRRGAAPGGKIKGFKPHAVAFLGYLVAHESHHRGQIGWTLKNTGHPLDRKVAFGLWEWGTR
jgi:uncharacterized damage-inducible protein DinB